MKKIIIITVAVIIAVVIGVLALFVLPWITIGGGVWFSPDPPKPQITSAEFPFSLVYSIGGETVTVNDVYVCEYEGIDIDEGQGEHIAWKRYIKSSKQEDLVLFKEGKKRIICDIGDPAYYMGDPEYHKTYAIGEIVPTLTLYEDYGDITTAHDLSAEECKDYKIKLISWEFSEPIKNEFK